MLLVRNAILKKCRGPFASRIHVRCSAITELYGFSFAVITTFCCFHKRKNCCDGLKTARLSTSHIFVYYNGSFKLVAVSKEARALCLCSLVNKMLWGLWESMLISLVCFPNTNLSGDIVVSGGSYKQTLY